MVSVSLVSVVYLLTLRSACCLETWEKESVVPHTLNGVSLNILQENPGRSLALAPFVIRLSLCKLAVVATGDTQRELLSFLEIKSLEDKQNDTAVVVQNRDPRGSYWKELSTFHLYGDLFLSQIKDGNLQVAIKCFSNIYSSVSRLMETDMTLISKIYMNYTDDFDRKFLGNSSLYGVGVGRVGFQFKQGAVNFVNNEMDARTFKRIRNVLNTSDIDENSSILLVNGIHMKPTWEQRFDIKQTGMKTFHLLNHTVVKIPMMNSVLQCNYMRDDEELYSAISMHLAIFGITATFIVTDPEKNIIDLLSILTEKPDTLENIKKKMKWQAVNVFLPRFRIKKTFDWTKYLKSVGLNLTFSNTNNGLNGILKLKTPHNMYVSKVKQKVCLDIDEMGSYRHGAGGDMMEAGKIGRMPPMNDVDMPQFVADRPFFFFISMMSQNGTTMDVANGAYYGIDELDV